ncbi:MAG TPA: ABC transporter permease [Candidatus Kryptonia bacterium]
MSSVLAALWSEALKARRSKVFVVTVILFAFVGLMMGLLTFVVKHPEIAGRSTTISAKASALGNADWPSFLSLLIQTILALGSLGYGIVTSWIFGREYSDRTLKDLLALPVPRSGIVAAKFIVVVIWSVILSLVLFVAALITGLAVGLSGWSGALVQHAFITFSVSALLTILLCTPVAFIASASRGYLLPVGVVILLLVMTQLVGMAMPGAMAYFPWAIPAICSGVAGSALPPAGLVSWIVLGLTSVFGYWGTVAWWNLADQS